MGFFVIVVFHQLGAGGVVPVDERELRFEAIQLTQLVSGLLQITSVGGASDEL